MQAFKFTHGEKCSFFSTKVSHKGIIILALWKYFNNWSCFWAPNLKGNYKLDFLCCSFSQSSQSSVLANIFSSFCFIKGEEGCRTKLLRSNNQMFSYHFKKFDIWMNMKIAALFWTASFFNQWSMICFVEDNKNIFKDQYCKPIEIGIVDVASVLINLK